MKKIMAVLSCEKNYAKRLCTCFNQGGRLMFTAVPFEDPDNFLVFLKKTPVTLLLLDQDFQEVGREFMHSGGAGNGGERRLIWLTQEEEALPQEERGRGSIRKYQSADRLLRSVMERCQDMDFGADCFPRDRPSRLIGVYSPVSRCGASSFAMVLAKSLQKNHRVLYLQLGEFTGLRWLTGDAGETGLEDAFYHLRQGKLSPQRIYSLIHTYDGLEYLPPLCNPDNNEELSGEDYLALIGAIFRVTGYDTMVLDMQHFSSAVSELMDVCDRIYMPVLEDAHAKGKLTEFDDYLSSFGRSGIREKLREVRVPEQKPGIRTEAYLDSLLYGPIGDLVRGLKEL